MNKTFQQIVDILMKNENLGVDKLKNGAILIGKVPHIAPLARLHLLFEGLKEDKIVFLQEQIRHNIPEQFKEFLRLSNGISIFSGSLNLYGFRANYNRQGDDIWQPFNFVTANTYEHPVDAYPYWIVIGSYQEDGSKIYIDDNTGKVYRGEKKYIGNQLNEWPDFWSMLLSETERIARLFDETGRKKDKNTPTVPVAQGEAKNENYE